jgi:predicted DNA-binding antitoxin AbrB/MazE fold protein
VHGLCNLQRKVMDVESTSIEKDLPNFSRIVHKGLGKLVLKQGETNHIRITSKEEILDLIKAEVAGDTLEIKMTDPIEVGFRTFLKLRTPDYRIEVTCTDLKEVCSAVWAMWKMRVCLK